MAPAPDADAQSILASAVAAFDAGEIEAGVEGLSKALRTFTAAGQTRPAALTAARLGWAYETFVGNRAAARAWFRRATRMLADEPDCVEQGWVALAGLGCDVDDPAELRERADLALDRARRFSDVDLEAKALADGGLARVQAGDVTEGMRMLDEAAALWCGPADDQDAAGMGVCSFFTACYYSAEFDRAGHWLDDLRRVGLLGHAPGVPVFLSSHCDAVKATALIELGRWADAEAVLTRAVTAFEACMPLPSWHPAIALADLRTRQGRLAEAEQLLLGKEAYLQALIPAARLHLARGDFELARAMVSRGLRMVADDVLRGVELLSILVEAELAADRVDLARASRLLMRDRAAGLAVPKLLALVAATDARLAAAEGDLPSAITAMEKAVDILPVGMPVMRVALGLELTRLHQRAGNRAAARVEAGRTTSSLAGLDVRLPAPDLELLDSLAAPAGASHPVGPVDRRPQQAQLHCEDGAWWVTHDGVRARLPATKGVRYLACLVAAPGVERHVLDLVDSVEGTRREGPDRRRLGDAGEVLDSAARQAYRHRVEQLRAEIEDCLSRQDDDRAAMLQQECDQLVSHLAAAFGLGGRSRTAASAAERARLNVTRSLRTAVARIRDDLPVAGEVLDRGLRTGQYCAFEPDPTDPVRWTVQRELNGSATS